MRIGILETGYPPGDLAATHGRYGDMMVALLGPGFETETFDVQAAGLPASADGFDGFIITGSPAGVYDNLPWIAPLEAFLRDARGRTKLVGVCFGHQIMAQAFGGVVVKSDKGWGLGRHEYGMRAHAAWMDGESSFAIPASHQDQVEVPPPDARVLAASDFTPFAVLDYGDAISYQGHPEFSPAFARALLEQRRPHLPPDAVAAALLSLEQPSDNDRVAGWIRRFLAG